MPEHESVGGNTPSGTYDTVAELADPQHEHHHQSGLFHRFNILLHVR